MKNNFIITISKKTNEFPGEENMAELVIDGDLNLLCFHGCILTKRTLREVEENVAVGFRPVWNIHSKCEPEWITFAILRNKAPCGLLL